MNKFLGLVVLVAISGISNAQDFDSKLKKDTSLKKPAVSRVIKGSADAKLTGTSHSFSSPKGFSKPELKGSDLQGLSITVQRAGNGNPRFVEVKRTNSLSRKAVGPQNKESLSKNFLRELQPILKYSDRSDFSIQDQEETKVKLQQTYKGIPLYGKEIVLHFNPFGEGTVFHGVYSKCDFELDTNAFLSGDQALQGVWSDLKKKTKVRELSTKEKEFCHYHGPSVNKVIYEASDFVVTHHVAYEIEVKPNVLETFKYIVDGNTGAVLRSYSILCSVDGPATANALDLHNISRTINTYLDGTQYKLINTSKPMYNASTKEGAIVTLDAQNTPGEQFTYITSSNNTWNHPSGVSAHYNAGIAYDYFKNNHNRNSINGQSGTIYSFVNVSDENNQGLDNAYWNGQAIFYGNGNTDFFPLAKALDVAGHEMTHGVVQNTANLEYYDESGAINESMADIFGFMMDSTDWLMGEDVVKPASFPSGALRNLQDPHNGGTNIYNGYQPKHVSEQYFGSLDNRGVHINSGIPNHAFYLLATSTSKTKAAAIFYKALSEYLTRFSDFVDLRIACIQAATVIYGSASAPEVIKTGQAFDAVGIVGGTTNPGNSTTLPVNPGQEYLLSVDTYEFDQPTLYRSSVSGTNFVVLSTTEILSHPSVTDDGSFAVYVGGDKRIYSMDLTNPSNPTEDLVHTDPIWSNVAISKDGNKIAAVTDDQDTSIFVYDFISGDFAQFHLYNPTYSSGIKSGGPLYADALEWDYSGQYLLYDAFNSLTNVSGTNLEYWDVNFMNVWNNQLNDFGTGEVQKLFSNLPEGVSIGNPVFAKNSPYVLAFDYTDETTGEYAVLGYDMEKNNQGVIFEGNSLGWPSYSKTDNMLASTFYYQDAQDGIREAIAVIDLNNDKISSQGVSSASFLIDFAKWPVYYAMGTRNIIISGVKDKVHSESNVRAYPNPFDHSFSLVSKEQKILEVIIYDLKGSLVKAEKVDTMEQLIDASDLPVGMYFIKVITEQGIETFKMVKN